MKTPGQALTDRPAAPGSIFQQPGKRLRACGTVVVLEAEDSESDGAADHLGTHRPAAYQHQDQIKPDSLKTGFIFIINVVT